MRAKFTSKTKFIIKTPSIFLILILSIIFLTSLFLNMFNKKITPNILNIASVSINKLNESILMNYKVSDLYKTIDLDNIIKIVKNKNDEIISVDFKLEDAYNALSIVANYIHNSLNDENTRKEILKYYEENLNLDDGSILLTIPIGTINDGVYLANLGPRIPVKVSYADYIALSLRLKLEDYGINTILVSIYIDCDITNNYIIPSVSKKITNSYSILIASKLIEGVVPDYYGGSLETKSNILNIPIE